MVPIRREAAEKALARDEVGTGIRYPRAAYQMCDPQQRPVIASTLVNAEWRLDPATVLCRLHEFDRTVPGDIKVKRFDLRAALQDVELDTMQPGQAEVLDGFRPREGRSGVPGEPGSREGRPQTRPGKSTAACTGGS